MYHFRGQEGIYLRKKYCNFISTQHLTREHGPTIRKFSFSLITQLLTKKIKLFSFERSELENN